MRLRYAVLLVALAIAVSGCAMAQKGEYTGFLADRPGGPAPGEKAPPPLAAQGQDVLYLSVVEPRKVVYTGSLAVVVDDVKYALAATKELAETMGGYMQRTTADGIVVRVPAGKFEQAVAAIEKLGTTVRKEVVAQDVTEEYVDLEIRLKNARALLVKLRALLEKAEAVKDALEVEREIARVTTEIEKMESQLNRLSARVAFATITATFTPQAAAPEELKVKLPFWWLGRLGLETLLAF